MSTQQSIFDALLPYYSFDDPDNIGIDETGSFNLSEFTPENIESVEGLIGQAVKFNGMARLERFADDDAFNVENVPFFISMWAKGPAQTAVERTRWIDIGKNAAIDVAGQISIEQTYFSSVKRLRFRVRREGSGELMDISANFLDDDQPHHVVVTYDETLRQAIYVDNHLVVQQTTGLGALNPSYSGGRVTISSSTATSPTGFAASWCRQALDEVIVAKMHATDEVVDWLYNNGEGRSWAEVSGQIIIPETDEEIFSTNFTEASGAPPWTSALIRAGDTQRLADHFVKRWLSKPGSYVLPVQVRYGDLAQFRPGTVRTFRADLPGLQHGKKLRIYGASGAAQPGTMMLFCRE